MVDSVGPTGDFSGVVQPEAMEGQLVNTDIQVCQRPNIFHSIQSIPKCNICAACICAACIRTFKRSYLSAMSSSFYHLQKCTHTFIPVLTSSAASSRRRTTRTPVMFNFRPEFMVNLKRELSNHNQNKQAILLVDMDQVPRFYQKASFEAISKLPMPVFVVGSANRMVDLSVAYDRKRTLCSSRYRTTEYLRQ
jgi:hypothetical protein